MARSNKIPKLFFFLFFLKVLSHSQVKFLPGFEGHLPFKLETGYVGVGESDDIQLFYYFVESERNPGEDPLMLWLTGGPGCSALSPLAFEIGPLNFNVAEYNGSLPTLILNPYSWTKISSIIFIDSPVGTGFSYATDQFAAESDDFKQAHHLGQFLRKWLMEHPDFLSNPVYIGGDSYSGIPLPILVQEIINGNEEGMKPLINLQGYILGNPKTTTAQLTKSRIQFAHRMALISDELYNSLERNCHGEFDHIDRKNLDCQKNLDYYTHCTARINTAHILEKKCAFASPKPKEISASRRYLDELPTIGCRNYPYLLSSYWANDGNVQKAIHIRKGSIRKWIRCKKSTLAYNQSLSSSFMYHVKLSSQGYRALVYSGDHDLVVPYIGTEAWIKLLNYTIVDDWRPWMLQDQVAGFTRTYANRMTYATVKGGGHTAPEYKPAECFAMYKRWLSAKSL